MKPILMITIGYILSYAWILLPKRTLKNPYPFFEMSINLQYYADYLLYRIFYVVLVWVIHDVYKTPETKFAVFLMIGFVIEYILIFNQPWFWLQSGKIVHVKPENGFFIPVGYSLLMGVSLIILTVIAWLKY